MKKKFLSLLLCSSILSMLFPVSAIQVHAEEDVGGKLKVPILNASNYNDSNLFNKYVKNTPGNWWTTSPTLSAGPLFKVTGQYNSRYMYSVGFNEKSDTMSMMYLTTWLRQSGNDRWSAEFKMKYPSYDFQNLLDTGQIQMKFGAKFANYGNSQPSMKFKGRGIDGSSLPNNATVVKESSWMSVTKEDLINDSIVMSGGKGGDKAVVSRPYVLFADMTRPTIQAASAGNDSIFLDFGEPLRKLGNVSDMTLKLRASNLESGVENISLTATALRITNNGILFTIDNPDNIRQYQITRIDEFQCRSNEYKGQMYGISLADNYLYSSSAFYGTEYKKVDNAPKLIDEYFTANTPVTDMAGNSLSVGKKDLTPFSLIVDKVAPEIDSVEIAGSMINANTTEYDLSKYSQASDWPEDIDRSSIFAGVGDTVTFSMITTKKITRGKSGSICAVLNIEDNGSPVELVAEKMENTYDGVNKREATKITFQPITITESMTAKDANTPIKPIRIEVKNIWDLHNNSMKSKELTCVPRQQIYLDNIAPQVTADSPTGNINEGEFCVPITFNDGEGAGIVSGFVGLTADFAWVYDGDRQHTFQYAITYSPEAPKAEDYKTAQLNPADQPAWNRLNLPVSEYYLHIKTDADEIKNTKLIVRANDWAGNIGNEEVSLETINIDRTAPEVALVSVNTEYQDNTAKITAKVRVDDFNTEGLRAEYQIVDKGAAADDSKWELAELIDGVFEAGETLSEAQKYERDFLVRATDNKGNVSKIERYAATADLTKAKAKYTVVSDLSQLNTLPEIQVSAPENPEGKAYADTRVILAMGDQYYARVYSNTADSENLFNFEGTWYQLTYNQDQTAFSTVEEVTDKTALESYYGVVRVKFESAFADLTPVADATVIPSDSEQSVSYQEEGNFDVLYAPARENSHQVTFAKSFKDADGNQPEVRNGHITRQQTMTDIRLDFSLSNALKPDWGIKNIDFEKSYLLIRNFENREVYRAALSRNANQTFAMPERDMDGNLLDTDAYTISVYLYQIGNDTPQEFRYDTAVVLDNIKPSKDSGITKYEILPDHRFSPINPSGDLIGFITKESETPFTTINIGAAQWAETDRNTEEAYALEQSGMFYTAFTLTGKSEKRTLYGEKLGLISGLRLWNKACTGGEELEFKATSDSREYRVYNSNIVDSLDGTAATGDLQLARGMNTICYQVKLENGNVSPIYEFTVNAVESVPQIAMKMTVEPSQNVEETGGTMRILSADAAITNVFSENGEVTLYHAYKGKDNNYASFAFKKIEVDEPVHMQGDSLLKYQSYTDPGVDEKRYAAEALIAVDEYGNVATIVPQFRDGEKYVFESEVVVPSTCGLNSSNFGSYIYQMNGENVDVSQSTICVDDGETLPMQDPPIPNESGYMGVFVSENTLLLKFTKPWDSEKTGEVFLKKLTVTRHGVHGDVVSQTFEDGTNLNGLTYVEPTVRMWADDYNRGTRIDFNGDVWVQGDDDYLNDIVRYFPIFSNGTYDIEVTDFFGKKHTVPVSVDVWEDGPQVTVSPIYQTRGNVTVTMTADYNITVTEKEGNHFADIQGSGTKNVTATVAQPTDLIMSWNDGTGEKSRTMYIGNNEIKPIVPKVVWDYSEAEVEDGCVYGSVTATLVDENGSTLRDSATGEVPEHTFYPDGETEFTFSGYENQHGDRGADFTAVLPVTVKPIPSPEEWQDTVAPSVGIVGYVVRNGIAKSKNLMLKLYDETTEYTNAALPEYEGYEVVADSNTFMQKMGWSTQYRLNVNISDHSAVKLIAKQGLSAAVPSYDAQSDVIDGVRVNGRTVDITKNVQFTLFAVDSCGNAKVIPMHVENIGDAPVPHLEKVASNDLQKVKVYLVPPADGQLENLRITDEGAKLETGDGSYQGFYYVECTGNADVIVHYSYTYKEQDESGQLSTSVTEIDKAPARVLSENWSENANSLKTNRNVTVQIRFDKAIKDARWENAAGNAPEIYKLDNQVTVSYSQNIPSLTMICTAINGQTTTVALNAVENIDKTMPEITEKITVSPNHKKATVTLEADEEVIFREAGKQGTTFTREVNQNGEYTYHFSDLAGNLTEKTITVDQLVFDPLLLSFSMASDGANSQSTPEQLGNIKIGDSVYVRSNRDCSVMWNSDLSGTAVTSGTWTALAVKEDQAGLYPMLRAVDGYGNEKRYQFMQITPLDKQAPKISLKKGTLDVQLSLSDAEILSLLKANAEVHDNETASDKISLDIQYTKPAAPGTVTVQYTAKDEAGNQAVKYASIHFYGDTELRVTVNGNLIYRDMVVIGKAGEQSIVVESGGEPYSVTWKNGIKTVGQMKIGTTALVNNREDAEPMSFTPKKPGYYTFCVQTQGHNSYRFVLYIQ